MTPLVQSALGFAAIGALASLLANRTLSIYHDGVRPLVPSLRAGEMNRSDLARHAWRISWGFVAFFALPFTLLSGVMVSHTVFLAADVIGLAVASPVWATLAGGAWGALTAVVLSGAVKGLAMLPVDVTHQVHLLLTPLTVAFALVPAVGALKTRGVKAGAVVLAISFVAYLVWGAVARGRTPLTPAGAAAIAGLAAFVIPSLLVRPTPVEPELLAVFSGNMKAARRGWPLLLAVGALTAWVASAGWLAGDPGAAMLLGGGHTWDAAVFALISAVGFFPLAVTSAQASGAYTTQGYCDWIPAAGYVFSGSPWAPVAGAGLMAVELAGLSGYTRFLLGRPALMEVCAGLRDAMTTVLEISFLAGSILAAGALWPGVGPLALIGLYLLNETSGSPILRMAAAPVGLLAVGLAANLWRLFGGAV